MIIIGKNRLDGKPVHIDEALRGGLAGVECYGCGGILIKKAGNTLPHHFAHKSRLVCSSGETAIHQYAKLKLAELREICIRHYPSNISPSIYKFDYSWPEYVHEGLRIDCYLYDEKLNPLAVEVKVTHPVPEEKIRLFKHLKLPAIEVDLSKLPRGASSECIAREITSHHCNVTWLYNPHVERYNSNRFEYIKESYKIPLDKNKIRNRIKNRCNKNYSKCGCLHRSAS